MDDSTTFKLVELYNLITDIQDNYNQLHSVYLVLKDVKEEIKMIIKEN